MNKQVFAGIVNSTQEEILEKIKSLALEDPNVAVVWLYGSRADNSANADSDYDFAIAFNQFPEDEWGKRLQPELVAQAWADALQLPLEKISVVDFNHIPLALALSIVNSNTVLVAKDSVRLAREENRVSSMWELDQVYHRKQFG
jgi:predicted nucleotidyltransferase